MEGQEEEHDIQCDGLMRKVMMEVKKTDKRGLYVLHILFIMLFGCK